MQCQRVVVRHCTVDVGDDGICMKAGAGQAALKNGPCKDILIEYNTVYHAHGGFVIGSEFSGGMENITVRHNTFSGTDTGLRFKSAPERGGLTKNIRISDIVMNDIQGEAVVFETTYADRPAGYEDNQAAVSEAFLPDFQDIVMERLTCWGAKIGIRASGNLQMIHDITVKDAVFHVWDKSTQIDVPQMIALENVRFL
jgi:polygalacturonase